MSDMDRGQRQEITRRIKELGVTKKVVAKIARIHRPQFVSWTTGKRRSLSGQKLSRVLATLDGIEKALNLFTEACPGLALDKRDAEFMARLVESVRNAEMRFTESSEPQQSLFTPEIKAQLAAEDMKAMLALANLRHTIS